jgi:cyclophilin family peptidyl-prolyl cis-trans isomerase/HEAT repeat protein
MNRFLLLLLFAAGLCSCNKSETSINKFADPVMSKIADLQDRRSSDSLYTFFKHENPAYRKEAALAFASIQDSAAVDQLSNLLQADPDTMVRRSAAFSLGQIRSQKSVRLLEAAIANEQDVNVRNEALEAYGKVTRQWKPLTSDADVNEGIAWSLFRSGQNNAVDPQHYSIASSLLAEKENERTRLGAAHFFSRGARNPGKFLSVISNAALNDPSPEVRMAAASALRKIVNDTSLIALENVLKNEKDHRVRVQALAALQAFPFEKSKDHLLGALNDVTVNVGITASEAVKASVTENYWIDLANRVNEIKNWRIQANIYEAILKVTDNKSVIDEIKRNYQNSYNPYQKAALLSALRGSVNSAEFIFQEMTKADTPVVRSSAAGALVALNRSNKFQPSMKKRFVEIYKAGVETGDVAVIGAIAGALTDSTLGYRAIITDYSFLQNAKSKLSLPRDIETLQPLEAAIAYFEGRKIAPEVINEFNHPIDWSLVRQLPKDLTAVIKTSLGNITIRLLVEQAPGSVANFVALANNNYFDNKLFHRVVPNFVIQAGCNRGDGWGSEDYSIRSEFTPTRYKTGSMGMASAGKDTEGTQWFITHSPTPHLDGRYTIFAEVINGMEVVQRMEVGERITDVEINITSGK